SAVPRGQARSTADRRGAAARGDEDLIRVVGQRAANRHADDLAAVDDRVVAGNLRVDELVAVHVEIARHDIARTLDECLERPLCCAALDPRLIVHPMLRGGAFLRALDHQQIARAAGAVTYLVRARGIAKYDDE